MLKFADMLQPPMPAPAAPSPMKPPAVMAPPPPQPTPMPKPPTSSPAKSMGMSTDPTSWSLQGAIDKGFGAAQDLATQAKNSPAVVAGMTENTPPLANMTHHLPESMQQPVNSALGFLQKGVKQVGPGNFAGLMGGIAPGVTKGLLSTPIGLPALVGLHGLLRGGESFAAANTFFRPLLGKVGL